MKPLSLSNLEWLENMKAIYLVLILSFVFYTKHSQADLSCEGVMRTYVRSKLFKGVTQEQVELLSNSQALRLLVAIKDNEILFFKMIKWVLPEQIPFLLNSIPSQYFKYLTLEQVLNIPPVQREEVESIRNQKEEDVKRKVQRKTESSFMNKTEMRIVK